MTFQRFTGREYLKIDIANNFGLDKKDWDERIEWFNSNEHQLETLTKEAEEPALFYAGLLAWDQTKAGVSSTYPISLDATASGLQLLSILSGCEKSGRLCNVIDTGHREDAYTGIYGFLLARVGDSAKISRDDVKKAIMTALYSSRAVPRRVFGEGSELLAKFYETMEQEAPGAWYLNESFLGMWDHTTALNEWILPDGFRVLDKVMDRTSETIHFLNQPFEITRKVNRPIPEGRSLGANVTHSLDGMVVREMGRRCTYDPRMIQEIKDISVWTTTSLNRFKDQKLVELWKLYEYSGFLSARILQFLDSKNAGLVDRKIIMALIASLPPKPFRIMTIHDCFRCLPNYGNDLRWQYNTILADISRSNMLQFITTQLVKKQITVNKLSKMDVLVQNANYALS